MIYIHAHETKEALYIQVVPRVRANPGYTSSCDIVGHPQENAVCVYIDAHDELTHLIKFVPRDVKEGELQSDFAIKVWATKSSWDT
jgi:hypothetical protein